MRQVNWMKDLISKGTKKKKKEKKTILHEYYGEAKPLKKSLDENLSIIKKILGDPSDLIIRELVIGKEIPQKIALIIIDGLTNGQFVHDFILKGLVYEIRTAELSPEVKINSFKDILLNCSLPLSDVEELSNFKDLFEKLLSGDSVILFDKLDSGLVIDTKGWQDRGIIEPSAETVIRGSRDSFNETLRTNTMLIRRRIKDINLRVINRVVGTITKTSVTIMYLEGLAKEDIVKDVIDRIDLINIDGILESGNIEELLVDNIYSLFPTMYTTERPDKVAGNLLEGRIAILTDGTPFVLVVPAVFMQFFQSSEDYYQRWIFASFIRSIRYLSFFLALLTPSVYIAITTFHHEMLPTSLLLNISGQRESVPFPAVVEVFFMEVTFEILREAGLRMPRAIGSAISIVGALVLGEAAVNAGVVSNIMVIIVSLTAITSLIFPEYSFSSPVRLLRFVFIILSSIIGLYGIAIGLMMLTIHLCSLQSFGVPYMYPLAPLSLSGLKDAIIRTPIKTHIKRPQIITENDLIRQSQTEITNKKSGEK